MATTWDLVAVPAQDVDEVKALVARNQSERGEPTSPGSSDIPDDQLRPALVKQEALDEHVVWSTDALARLASGDSLTAQRWTQVMDLCSTNPEQFFATDEIVASPHVHLSVNEWRDACRKIGTHLRANYDDVPRWEREPYEGHPMWPLVSVSGRELKVKDQLYVAITREQAARWVKVRNSDG